jgi:hypothetical protein
MTRAAELPVGHAAAHAGFAQAIGDCSDALSRSLGDIVDTPFHYAPNGSDKTCLCKT